MLPKSKSCENLIGSGKNKKKQVDKLIKSKSCDSLLIRIPKSLPPPKKLLLVQRKFNKKIKQNDLFYGLFCVAQDISCGVQYSQDIHTHQTQGVIEFFIYVWFSDTTRSLNQRLGILVLINLFYLF